MAGGHAAAGSAAGRVRVGIDTGGTFTDVVAIDEGAGRIVTAKTPSTPADPAAGFMTAVRKALDLLDAAGSGIAAISHGTTVATNQLLEDRIGGLGLITTEGFEFILEIARQSVPDGYGNSYFWVKPPRIVPVHRVKTVGGRLDHRGAEIRPFDESGAVRAARWFKDQGIDTVGVCFLHSYANPAHELRMREVLAREHPAAVVSLSCEVLPEYREYERAVTTLVDAAVKPTIARYIAQIADRLADVGDAPFYVMKSNGGVLSAAEVVHQPITTVLSGPAAGALGAALIARTAGTDSAITLDGGGTSTDVAVVLAGAPTLTTEGSVGRHPSKIPMIDIVTVGAGGGSVAWISPEGTLKVGPRSAGADPGPLCYGRGGTEVTVTDAHVFLGRVPPALLNGEIPLDVAAAGAGVEALAGKLGLTPERTATGILEISGFNQANAIRQITVRRGLDVRDFPLVAFGGSGPLLACRLIDILGVPSVVVPENPGNLSAFGLLTVDVKNDYVQTYVARDADLAAVGEIYARLERRAADALDREGFARERHRYVRSADLRYFGQAFEVTVPAPGGPVDEGFRAEVVRRFHDAHERLYGYCYRDDGDRHPAEWVNLRVSGVGPIERPRLTERPRRPGTEPPAPEPPAPRPAAHREVYFDEDIAAPASGRDDAGRDGGSDAGRDDRADDRAAAGRRRCPIYRRADLYRDDVIDGPAVVEEYGSTLPLHPGFRARVDAHGNLVIGRQGAAT
jgi:N-methylhydantoinase A